MYKTDDIGSVTVVEAPRKKTVKEIAKAAKNAVKAAKEPAAAQGETVLGPRAGGEVKDAGSSGRGRELSEAERLRIEMEEARENSMRAKQEKQREAIRRKSRREGPSRAREKRGSCQARSVEAGEARREAEGR